ncbi:MAG: hypothetical protein ACRBCJ_14320 [Hyphomicrobiaceae bacterium]
MSLKPFGLLLTAVIMAATTSLPFDYAEAGRRYRGSNGLEAGFVTAHSRYTSSQISAPVRRSRLGPQVRLPSGYWTYCRTSCSETLRVKTIDANANLNNGLEAGAGLGRECGIFGCLEYHLRR